MQKYFIILLIVSISTANCHILLQDASQRSKRSPQEEGFFSRAKTGLINFGKDVTKVAVKGYEEVKNVAVKGYEETKNLFSSDRKVGDYVINSIDVRFDDSENSLTTEGNVMIDRNKRETKLDHNREVEEMLKVHFEMSTTESSKQ